MQFLPLFLPWTPPYTVTHSLSFKIKAEKHRNRKSKFFFFQFHKTKIKKERKKKARPSLFVQLLSISSPILLFSQNTFSKNKNNNRDSFPSLQILSSPQILSLFLYLSLSLHSPFVSAFPKKTNFLLFFSFSIVNFVFTFHQNEHRRAPQHRTYRTQVPL